MMFYNDCPTAYSDGMKTFLFLMIACACMPCLAADTAPAIRELAGGKKQEVRHSMMGPRDALLFYTFEERRAVLVLHVSPKDGGFTVGGKVFLFDPSTNVEGLAKWVNNQHSDGLFVDAAEPVGTTQLPADACIVTGSKELGEAEQHTVEGPRIFRDHEVSFSIKRVKVDGKFDLKAFEDKAKVFVKSAGK